MSVQTKQEQQVLDFINKGRRALGKDRLEDIPVGTKNRCPVQRGLGLQCRVGEVGSDALYAYGRTGVSNLRKIGSLTGRPVADEPAWYAGATPRASMKLPGYVTSFIQRVDVGKSRYSGGWFKYLDSGA